MRIDDEIYITNSNIVAAGMPVPSVSIKDRNINDLIADFNKYNIRIEVSNSEQEIEYDIYDINMERIKRKAIVPLDSVFGNHVNVTGYILRSGRLELVLNNHHQTSRHGGGLIGESSSKGDGIHCSLGFSGSYKEAKIIENAKQVLKEFYK